MRVGGLNMKGIFTRIRTPKMAAYVLREFWVKPVEAAPAGTVQQPAGAAAAKPADGVATAGAAASR
jgi:hypothetical protein